MQKNASHAAGLHRASLSEAPRSGCGAGAYVLRLAWDDARGRLYLATLGLSRPHHRILYVVARQPDLSIGSLIEVLGISKQAVNRPLGLLLQRKLLTSKRSPEQHRSKLLRLTEAGKRTEQRASDHERKVLREAFDRVGPPGAAAWMAVMGAIADNN